MFFFSPGNFAAKLLRLIIMTSEGHLMMQKRSCSPSWIADGDVRDAFSGCKVNVLVNYLAVSRVGSSRRRCEGAEAVSRDGFLPVEVITLKYPKRLSCHAGRPNVKQSAINCSTRLGMSPLILDVL